MRQSRRVFDEYQSEYDNPDGRYNLAYKRVKRIKGFYVHAMVYVLVNLFIIASSYTKSSFDAGDFFRWETFSTALFWGIGLAAHGLSVFGRNLFFGNNWEERKIQEFMDKEKSEKWE
ncbi:2TM domain-containing protein [Flavobacterium soyangense]|uniref:2TM domain-containing protein n=1 Tax=Flavobacterium soyangense TaxID=2023265 RepID=A0A930U8Y6_9FLAO|nr:2TM domain-containing protein [Flavobacterium soyangense]MBF2708906.1 2TM domain-containing protein [Flavobacterium soyangense]